MISCGLALCLAGIGVSGASASTPMIAAISAGADHTCAILTSGGVECWGYNTYGQLGNGTTTPTPTPVAVTGITSAVASAAGTYYTCALLTSGAVECWGYNAYGQLGNNGTPTGTFTCTITLSAGSEGSAEYPIEVAVGGNYTLDPTDVAVVDVAQPLTSDFMTGGGYLVAGSSASQYAADAGQHINFGLNVKYNKNGKNLQGHVLVIFREGAHVYQIWANDMTSLGVTPCATSGCPSASDPTTADFVSKATLQDVTDPNAPISITGNTTLEVSLSDAGDPGSSDQIAISLYDSSGALLFSSDWNGTTTLLQTLAGGNLAAH